MTDFVLRITLPCMIFNSFQTHLTPELLKQASLCLAVAFFVCFLAWIMGKFIYNMYPFEKRSILQYATLVNNSGFLGLPIVAAVLGDEGLLLAAIFIIPNRIFMWTAGISIFEKSSDKKGAFLKLMKISLSVTLPSMVQPLVHPTSTVWPVNVSPFVIAVSLPLWKASATMAVNT